MTFNIGPHFTQKNKKLEYVTEMTVKAAKIQILNLLKQNIKFELSNRIDDIIMFTILSTNKVNQIVNLQLESVKK